ncbi:MAG: DNA glycosylase AlkZ-like family protein, partial [Gammaproteobacteria bacterium]
MKDSVLGRRLINQRIDGPGHRRPEDVVAWSGAVQAQEYEPAKWGVGLRMRSGAIDADVQCAFDDGRILRTHVLRPTWHFVLPEDIRWMLALTAPRVSRAMSYYNRTLGLDERTFRKSNTALERALRDGAH